MTITTMYSIEFNHFVTWVDSPLYLIYKDYWDDSL